MSMMEAAESRDIFLSCFKCGRIVRSSDAECPRCGLQFGPGTLFECPFCSGLIWRNATKCASCGIDLTEFSESVVRTSSGFDMDDFVDGIINNELDQLKSTIRRVACPGCGLMIRGDEEKCPRCDLPLEEAKVDCPVCGEKISISAKSCGGCQAVFEELPEEGAPVEEAPAQAAAAAPVAVAAEPEVHAPRHAKARKAEARAQEGPGEEAPGQGARQALQAGEEVAAGEGQAQEA
ncbi:MAG: hypothetical protein AB1793_00605 [Candidatus Thermoplasmatota archaeon]